MRAVPVLALVASALSLAACAGGGSGGGALGLASDLPICGLACDNPPDDGTTGGGTTGGGTTGGGTTGGGTTGGGSPGANNGNGGNTTTLTPATGDPVIALEAGKVVSSKANPSLGKLTVVNGTPDTAKYQIDTNTANNSLWAAPKTMNEYMPGTLAGGGLGGTYQEFRAYQNSATDAYDEVLQVWTFNNSYAVQYRDETSGSEVADKQAWGFGGLTSTSAIAGTSLPTSGTANYSGRFGSVALSSNWENSDDPLQAVNYNNSWRVIGSATATVDFANNNFSGRLNPETWRTEEDFNNFNGGPRDVTAGNVLDPNHAGFMTSDIVLDGKLTRTATGNSIAGGATMDSVDGWLSDGTNNPFYGAIYGAGTGEITGAFATSGANPAPIGGTFPLNNPTRGFISHSGVFNVQ